MHTPAHTAAACSHHREAVTTALDHILACPHATVDELVFAAEVAALSPSFGGLGLTIAGREANGNYAASAIHAFSAARLLHPAFATIDLTTHTAPSLAALRVAHAAIITTHRRVTAAWAAIDETTPTVDRTGAETPAFRPAGLPEFVQRAAHLPPPEDSDADAAAAPPPPSSPPPRLRPPPPC